MSVSSLRFTSLRLYVSGAASQSSALPQLLQNLASAAFLAPQCGQNLVATVPAPESGDPVAPVPPPVVPAPVSVPVEPLPPESVFSLWLSWVSLAPAPPVPVRGVLSPLCRYSSILSMLCFSALARATRRILPLSFSLSWTSALDSALPPKPAKPI